MIAGALESTRPIFRQIVEEARLSETEVSVLVKPLTPEEAVGSPGRRDCPILLGKERVIEAEVAGNRGHAFTDTAQEFLGQLKEVLDLPLDGNGHRAIYAATLNATLRHVGRLKETLHCRDEDPERCGATIPETLRRRFVEPCVGLVGLNPAIAEHLVETFGVDRVRITDLDPANIGKSKHAVEIWDGTTHAETLIDTVDVVLLTGTTLVNGTFDRLWQRITTCGKTGLVYGVTAAGVCELLGYERICPYARDQ
ncbi:MAG: hypothetical protein JSW58_14970 [Candidatus Latescibacterota bacterium]|nr:MAG: hypothetical protein JSW58_14970 [Candidatus Latescibacterota bacterium]